MKFRSVLLFVALILVIANSQAQSGVTIQQQVDYHRKPSINDTLTKEFNLKKQNTSKLIIGKTPDDMLNFYTLYLQETDIKRADSLIISILNSSDSISYRHSISLISYRNTSDTKTQQLFLSDPGDVQAYWAYFSKFKASSLQSNDDKRAHYLNYVSLDSAYSKMAPDSVLKKKMGGHYNSLAWYSMLTQKLDHVSHYLKQSIKYDPQLKYPYSNMPLLLLLKGRYKESKSLYIKLKDQPFDTPGSTYKDVFLEDFKELKMAGVTNKNFEKIIALLNTNK